MFKLFLSYVCNNLKLVFTNNDYLNGGSVKQILAKNVKSNFKKWNYWYQHSHYQIQVIGGASLMNN